MAIGECSMFAVTRFVWLDEQSRRTAQILQSNFQAPPPKKGILDSLEDIDPSKNEVHGKLRVEVVKATNLPRMDYLRNCDGYCVLWIDHGPDPATHVSEVVPHEPNPSFNQTFLWDYNSSTTKLYISIW